MKRILEPEAMDTAEEAAGYDDMDHSEANAAFVARLEELGASGRALDIGCGPGQMAFLVCARLPDAQVLGVDLAHHMLALARAKLPGSPHEGRIEFRHMDAKALDLPDASFDAVYSNTILHHIPDPLPFLREARRVLAPGGALLIRDLFRPPSEERLEELVALHTQGCTDYQRKLFADSLHAAFTPEELRALAAEAGLDQAEVVVDSDRHVSIQIASARR